MIRGSGDTGSLASLLDAAAHDLGDRIAIDPPGGPQISFAALRDRVRHLASSLEEPTVALVAENSPAVVVTMFATFWAGATYAPINPRLPAPTIDRLLERLGPHEIVTDEPADRWDARARTAGQALSPARDAVHQQPVPVDPAAAAVLLYTSGTVAEPKGALLAHRHLQGYLTASAAPTAADPDEANLLVVPPFHVAGVVGVLSSVNAGRRIVPLPRFTPQEWVRVAHEHGATHAFLVPTMLARIMEYLRTHPEVAPPPLHVIRYGGARMPRSLVESSMDLFEGVDFANVYGMTETSSTVATLTPSDHRRARQHPDPVVRGRLGSAGRALPGIEISVRDQWQQDLPPGRSGAIWVRGAQVAGRYLEADSTLDEHGWMATGDVGHLDEEGYLFVEGRGDDVIIRGGENISPFRIEEALRDHPGVARALVGGVPDDEWGQQIAAVVVLDAPADPEELRRWVAERLGSFHAPRWIVVDDALPETATGKARRSEVADRVRTVGEERSSMDWAVDPAVFPEHS